MQEEKRIQFGEAVMSFGFEFLKGFGNDYDKAIEALNVAVQFTREQPKVIPVLSSPENIQKLSDVAESFAKANGNSLKQITTVKKAYPVVMGLINQMK
jgi:hypothetical protein